MVVSVSKVPGCVSVFAFASLVAIPVVITSSGVGIKICAMTAGIKKYKSIIKKKKKKHDKRVFLGKGKLNIIEFLISKALIDPYISHDEFVAVNIKKILRNERRNKKPSNFCIIHYIKTMEIYCVSCKKNTANEN